MKLEILKDIIYNLGGKIYVVGGAVRDRLLNIKSNDKDFVITGIKNPNNLPFDKVAGKDFPVFLVNVDNELCEVALARKERSNGNGHKDFHFDTDASITIEEDLFRRDLTINAMAIDLSNNKLIDPFHGREDLDRKILRHVSEFFKEDPLRVFRLARFLCRFENFIVANETIELCSHMKNSLGFLAPERVFIEMKKALLSKKPSRFFIFLDYINCLDVFFREIKDLKVPDRHDVTAFLHTMKVMDNGSTLNERFGLLCHDFGKGRTPAEKHPSHFGHDELGIIPVEDFCNRLKVPNEMKDIALACCSQHMRNKLLQEMKIRKVFIYFSNYKKLFPIINVVSFIDSAFREDGNKEEAEQVRELNSLYFAKFLEVEKKINGKHLIERGLKPSVEFGKILFEERYRLFRQELAKL